MTTGYPKRTIERGMNRPVRVPSGTVPEMSSAMLDWFQPMEMMNITKGSLGFEVIETGVVTAFRGVIHPFSPRQLMMRPEGQRAWTWLQLYAERVLALEVDDVLTFLGKDTRVMARKDWSTYGFLEYHVAQDYLGSRPLT